MDWTTIIALIGVLLGGGSITATVVTICLKRKFEKEDKKDELAKDIRWLKDQSKKRDVTISRLQILNLIQHSPKDHKAILSECEYYFLTLRADSWLFDVVSDWAIAEKINIDYIRIAHDFNNNKGGKNA